VRATNNIGDGDWSEANIVGVRIQTEPESPASSPTIREYGEY